MDRARRAAATSRRKPLPGSASPQPTSEASMERLQSPTSPGMPQGTNAGTPQTAPQSRRGSRAAQQAFAFSTPGPNRPQSSKKRSRTMDGFNFADDDFADDGSPKKGGHSLRKRARVDYTLEHIDDEVMVPNSTMASSSSTRGRKRKSDNMDASEDFYGPTPAKKRGNSLGADALSSVRRNPARKSTETRIYEEDDDVKDVIEVGVSFSDVDESDPPRASHSGDSSTAQSPEASWKLPAATAESEAKAQQPAARIHQDAHAPTKSSDLLSTAENDASVPAQKEAIQSPKPEACSVSYNASSFAESTLNSTQDTQQTFSVAEEPIIEPTDLPDNRPSPAADAKDAPKPQVLAIEQKAAEDEVDPSPKVQAEKSSAADLVLQTTALSLMDRGEGHVGAATATTVEENAQPKIDTAGPVPQDMVAIAKETNHSGEQPQSPGQKLEENKIVSVAHGIQEGERPISEPPAITVSDASQPSIISTISGPAEPAPGATSGTPAVHISPPEGTLALHQSSSQSADQGVAHANSVTGQTAPAGQDRAWAHLSPYLHQEYDTYPVNKSDNTEASGAGQTSENKDNKSTKSITTVENPESSGEEGSGDAGNPPVDDSSTAALGTPAGESSAVESTEPTAINSPAAATAEENCEDANMAEPQGAPGKPMFYKYRRIRSPADFAAALQNHRQMSTEDLYELLDVVNAAMREWQHEYQDSIHFVADWENATRRQDADAKYENKTRDLTVPGLNHAEPDFSVKGYKAKQKDQENIEETRWMQAQDRIMAASYYFPYDPHPSKIGRQDLENCIDEGVKTRSRSLRNQPKQTAKASEAEEVTTKRTRKPVQHFDPASQQPSRVGTPASNMTGKKRQASNRAANGEPQQKTTSGKARAESTPDTEEAPQQKDRRRRRTNAVAKEASFNATEGSSSPSGEALAVQDGPFAKPGRPRGKKASRLAEQALDDEGKARPAKPQRKSHVLTLKIPKSKNLSEPSSAITDNGDSRPSTASSDSTSHTAESSYSFRPKRQKRFRDEPEDDEISDQQPPKKRGKRAAGQGDALAKDGVIGDRAENAAAATAAAMIAAEAGAVPAGRKVPKIKVISKTAASRNGTPGSQPATAGEAEDRPKDYKSMTKSEKMSASMKSRWANGNMAGAVEKRKATLAAKKAAQAAADNKAGTNAPKPTKVRAIKKEHAAREEQQQQAQSTEFTQHGVAGGAGSPPTANN
ncbi:hypothetical protein HRG_006372 [Hirsutella rhossiliensis]|uniref:Uncharacterized protein n=1 Tax=Hirsutella rhossiliensis TaxID=111463 RepID=A0A9P8SI57_9HYPO|nr:uncharacterized protein HRG_06372 [Hirsutella rhossiliensis]KAH0962270.1 hypothetical protein HRG_06372 [Hirsutella rhossiliensis]